MNERWIVDVIAGVILSKMRIKSYYSELSVCLLVFDLSYIP